MLRVLCVCWCVASLEDGLFSFSFATRTGCTLRLLAHLLLRRLDSRGSLPACGSCSLVPLKRARLLKADPVVLPLAWCGVARLQSGSEPTVLYAAPSHATVPTWPPHRASSLQVRRRGRRSTQRRASPGPRGARDPGVAEAVLHSVRLPPPRDPSDDPGRSYVPTPGKSRPELFPRREPDKRAPPPPGEPAPQRREG